MNRATLPALDPVKAIGSAGPDFSVQARRQRKNHVAQQAVFHRIAAHVPILAEHIQPSARGSHPERSITILNNRRGRIGGEAVAHAERVESLIAQNIQAVGLSAHPQISLAIFHQREH